MLEGRDLWRRDGDGVAATASARPAAAPPRPVKIAPATATLRLWPSTRPVAIRPEASPARVPARALMNARVFGD